MRTKISVRRSAIMEVNSTQTIAHQSETQEISETSDELMIIESTEVAHISTNGVECIEIPDDERETQDATAPNLETVIDVDKVDKQQDVTVISDTEEREEQKQGNGEASPKSQPSQQAQHCIAISFANTTLLTKYKETFSAFCYSLTEFKCLEQGNKLLLFDNSAEVSTCIRLEQNEVLSVDDDDDDDADIVQKKRKLRDSCKDGLFTLDTEPNERVTSIVYTSRYNIGEDGTKIVEEKIERNADNRMCCFNCGGSHTVSDCPMPRDYNRIKQNRQKLMPKLTRYHEEGENKFQHLQAGVLSPALRNALGLRKHDIPAHVYKMRVMGYPPGWLEEAKLQQSSLALFDSDGKKDESIQQQRRFIDVDKVVDYPGFNCTPDRNFKDDFNYYGVPPYSTALCKENMIDFVNSMMRQQLGIPEEAPPEKTRSSSTSPTLIDLEVQKQQLLAQLTTNEDSTPSPTVDVRDPDISMTSTPPNTITKDEEVKEPKDDNVVDLDKTAEVEEICQTPRKTPETPTTLINSSLTGTPILKSLSPFSRLPCLDNFQKDVSPVINFENLPNSTGKYEQMSVVLERVRTMMKGRLSNST